MTAVNHKSDHHSSEMPLGAQGSPPAYVVNGWQTTGGMQLRAVARKLTRLPAAVILAFIISFAGPQARLVAQDCNANGVDDALDITDGTSQDCNNNGFPDECDITGGHVTQIIDATGDGAGNGLDVAHGIVVDGAGNAYVTGHASHNAFKITVSTAPRSSSRRSSRKRSVSRMTFGCSSGSSSTTVVTR